MCGYCVASPSDVQALGADACDKALAKFNDVFFATSRDTEAGDAEAIAKAAISRFDDIDLSKFGAIAAPLTADVLDGVLAFDPTAVIDEQLSLIGDDVTFQEGGFSFGVAEFDDLAVDPMSVVPTLDLGALDLDLDAFDLPFDLPEMFAGIAIGSDYRTIDLPIIAEGLGSDISLPVIGDGPLAAVTDAIATIEADVASALVAVEALDASPSATVHAEGCACAACQDAASDGVITDGAGQHVHSHGDGHFHSHGFHLHDHSLAGGFGAAPVLNVGLPAYSYPDLISSQDPTTFVSMSYAGRGERSIFDGRTSAFSTENVYLFEARYADGSVVEMQVNPEFGFNAAQSEAGILADAIGRLPNFFQDAINIAVIQGGDGATFGGPGALTMTTPSNWARPASTAFEEIILHEAGHIALDEQYGRSNPAWVAAQEADNFFASDYGEAYPEREDLSETLLYYMASRVYRDRIDANVIEEAEAALSNRFAYLDSLDLDLTTGDFSYSPSRNLPDPLVAFNDGFTYGKTEGDDFYQPERLTDNDTGHGTLRVISLNGSANNLNRVVDLAGGGNVYVDANGSFNFNADGDFDNLTGSQTAQTSFTYVIQDSFTGQTDSATVTFTITGDGSSAPVSSANAVNDAFTYLETEGDNFYQIERLIDNDSGSGALTVIELNGSANNLNRVVDLAGGGNVYVDANGNFNFNAAGDFDNLTDGQTAQTSFTYTIRDGNGGTDTASVVFTIEGIGQANGGDNLVGTIADDILQGTGFDDTINGGAGDDEISGGAGADRLIGGAGFDIFESGAGDDIMTGGTDSRDGFIFKAGDGADVITDFDRDDLFGFDPSLGFTNINQVVPLASDTSDGVFVDFGDGDSVLFADVSIDDLSQKQFLFL